MALARWSTGQSGRWRVRLGVLLAASAALSAILVAAESRAAQLASPKGWPFVRSQNAAKSSETAGVGLGFSKKNGAVVVDRLVPTGSAAAVGLKFGDRLVSIGKWPINADTDFETVEPALTGPPGSDCAIRVQRGDAILDVQMTRIPFDAIYARRQLFDLPLGEGTTLLAQTANEWFGIRVLEADLFAKGNREITPERCGELLKEGTPWIIRYEWARSRTPVPLGDAAAERGVATVDIRKDDIVLGPWRIERRKNRHSYWAVASSANLPVQVAGRDWLRLQPPWRNLSELAPRPAQDWQYSTTGPEKPWKSALPQPWQPIPAFRGNLPARVRLIGAGQPLANVRIRLEIDLGRRATLPGPTVTTDNAGVAELSLPQGTYYVRSILRALPGRGPDVYLAQPGWQLAQVPGEGEPIEAGRGSVAAVYLRPADDQGPVSAIGEAPFCAPAVDLQHFPVCALKGQAMPPLRVQRWLGSRTPAAKPNRKLLAVCMFAAEHSRGVRYAELCSEVQARLEEAGLQTVLASLDSMGASSENAVAEWASDHPPVAWVGPAGRELFPALVGAAVLFVDNEGMVCDGAGPNASLDNMLAAARRCLN